MRVHFNCLIGVKKEERNMVTSYMSLGSKGGEVLRAVPPANVA